MRDPYVELNHTTLDGSHLGSFSKSESNPLARSGQHSSALSREALRIALDVELHAECKPRLQEAASKRTAIHRFALAWLMVAFAILWILPTTLRASQAPVNVLNNGIALQGYDPVAYFVDGEPRKGRPDLSFDYEGARWLFSSETNRLLFVKNPGRYLPAYGGYCAYGISQGYLSGVDPQAWTILYGRLYLNCREPLHDLWLENIALYIKKADENWLRLTGHFDRTLQEPFRQRHHNDE